jgi:photosynthetic reaction center H subunit
MQIGAITGYFDVAQLALYVFWLFFAGLIFYLRTEDKREGFPMVTEKPGELKIGFPPIPKPKTFLLPDGTTTTAPRLSDPEPRYDATPMEAFPGSPLQPLGNPMLAGAGPAAWALRAEVPDQMLEHPGNRVQPLRVATDHYLDADSPEPRSMPAEGADGVAGGTVTDIWVDRAETMIRYLEVALTGGGSVLVPMPLCQVDPDLGRVLVVSIMGSQFADAPRLASPDQVTLREEDRIQAYFASGHMYATPERMEPLI